MCCRPAGGRRENCASPGGPSPTRREFRPLTVNVVIFPVCAGDLLVSDVLVLSNLVRKALIEDIGPGDVTSEAVVPKHARCRVRLVAKQHGVLSGMKCYKMAFQLMDSGVENWSALEEGTPFSPGDVLADFTGRTISVLSAERTAINFIQHLSGIATLTAKFAEQLRGLHTKIIDTRKTMPLLRALEKEAVLHGGGTNHRYALFDGILIKENHITAAGGITNAVQAARSGPHHLLRVEVEVRNLEELAEALGVGVDIVMLDNMSLEDMRVAARMCHDKGVLVEASGNVTLDRIRAIADTGVDFVSCGMLTHSAPAADLSLLIENV
ncbi:MAG: carboxylating nicotinate-nucleotide diphosphorylase [Candidatus Hydrogenedentes bacterium]|nr:carboxylating nicotinate-nucleotide diphosphorylase [Candidatus Hydrogenedentota bacterium]